MSVAGPQKGIRGAQPVSEPPPSELRQLIDYDPVRGLLTFQKRGPEYFVSEDACRLWNSRFAGKAAFCTADRGYRKGTILCRRLRAHRVAFAIHYGRWPDGEIDHINGDRSDNRLCNLREVDATTNARNQKRHTRNTSGETGVFWCRAEQKWTATLGRKRLGRFGDFEQAVAARKSAEIEHGYHRNHGRVT